MKKMYLIIEREYLERVRKKSFIIVTLLMPILMIGLMIAPTLMMLYSPGTLSGLSEALTQMKEQLAEDEAELRTLADSVLNKLSVMDDETFERLNLYPDF